MRMRNTKESKSYNDMKVKVKSLSLVWLFAIPWTVTYQAPPSLGFSRQEHWSGLPFPSPGNLPKPGIEPRSPALQTLYLLSYQGSHNIVIEREIYSNMADWLSTKSFSEWTHIHIYLILYICNYSYYLVKISL